MSNNIAPHAAKKPPQVTLVIGSGSVKCAAGLGVAQVLLDAGIQIERVVGCSAGALFGSMVAMNLPMDQAIRDAQTLWTKELTGGKNRMAWLRILAPKLFGFDVGTFGLRSDRQIQRVLERYYGNVRIEDLPIPFHVTATDLMTGDLVELSQGRLTEAVRASIAIPFAFAPVKTDGRMLVDGYLSDPMPTSVAIRNGAETIVAVGFESPMQTHIASPARFAFQMMAVMSNNLFKARHAFHSAAHHAELITIVPEFQQRIRLFDTDKIGDIVQAGAHATEAHLPYLRQVLGMDETPPRGHTRP